MSLDDLLRKCAERDEAHGIVTAEQRAERLAESDRRLARWNAMPTEQRRAWLRERGRPDVSDLMKPQNDGPLIGLMLACVVGILALGALALVLVGM